MSTYVCSKQCTVIIAVNKQCTRQLPAHDKQCTRINAVDKQCISNQ